MVGYKDYRSTPIGANFSVPDSCCFEYYEGCGYQIFHKSDVEIANIIFTHGCLTLLKDQVSLVYWPSQNKGRKPLKVMLLEPINPLLINTLNGSVSYRV